MSNYVNEEEIKLEPCDAFFGQRGSHTITTVADSSSDTLDGVVLFDFYNSDYELVEGYVWNNVGAAGTDPALVGKTGFEASYVADASATVIATAYVDAMILNTNLTASSVAGVVTYASKYFGATTIPLAGATDPGFTYATVKLGKGGPIGSTSDAITIAF